MISSSAQNAMLLESENATLPIASRRLRLSLNRDIGRVELQGLLPPPVILCILLVEQCLVLATSSIWSLKVTISWAPSPVGILLVSSSASDEEENEYASDEGNCSRSNSYPSRRATA
jgi:hypothetical protein